MKGILISIILALPNFVFSQADTTFLGTYNGSSLFVTLDSIIAMAVSGLGHIEKVGTPANNQIGSLGYWDLATGSSAAHFELQVSSTSTIEHDASAGVDSFDISTFGWIDQRGRLSDTN